MGGDYIAESIDKYNIYKGHDIKKLTARIGNIIIDGIYPPSCPVCAKPLGYEHGKRQKIHGTCRQQLKYIGRNVCLKCGKEINDENIEFCYDCMKKSHIYNQGVAVYRYTDGIKQSIYRYKYKNKREYAAFYGEEMYTRCKATIDIWKPQIIIPVPLHSSKYRERGFNQAELMAKSLSEYSDIPYDANILTRCRKTIPMKQLNDKERLKNLKNAFIIDENIVKYERVLVVDDIYTTGSTIDECARVLKDRGVERVYFICLCIGHGF